MPAPGDVRNGPVSCAAACGPVQVRVMGWLGSSRATEICLMYVFGNPELRPGVVLAAKAAAARASGCLLSSFSSFFASVIRCASEGPLGFLAARGAAFVRRVAVFFAAGRLAVLLRTGFFAGGDFFFIGD